MTLEEAPIQELGVNTQFPCPWSGDNFERLYAVTQGPHWDPVPLAHSEKLSINTLCSGLLPSFTHFTPTLLFPGITSQLNY